MNNLHQERLAIVNMKNEIRDIFAGTYMKFCQRLPIDEKKIVLKSFRGIECGDNPRAIFDALYAKRPDLHYVWVTADEKLSVPGARTVRHGSPAEIKELATAKIWIDNKRKGCWTSKRAGQFYLQTWHGGIALKRIEKDAEDKLPAYYIKSAKKDSRLADAFLSGSGWQTGNIRDAFWYTGDIWETGLPRNDILFRPDEAGKKIRQAFGFSETDKVVLYAPTFREDYSLDVYDLDRERLLAACRARFGGKWKLIMRLHTNISSEGKYFYSNDEVLNGCHYPIMSELVAGCDVLVTDYSSCMFDAAESGKISFIYASDVEDYLADRGFNFEFRDLPFAIAETNDELERNIKAFDENEYAARTEAFFDELQVYDNECAAGTVADMLLQIMEEK